MRIRALRAGGVSVVDWSVCKAVVLVVGAEREREILLM